MPRILDEQQNCGANKSIFNNLLQIRDILLGSIKEKSLERGILSWDLVQAFVKVKHFSLCKIMNEIGFEDTIIQFLKNTYSLANSSILKNGFLSQKIEIQSSVRQGWSYLVYLLNPS